MKLLYLIFIAIAVVVILTKYKQELLGFCTDDEIKSLTKECSKKTMGNPCCINQGIRNTYNKGVCDVILGNRYICKTKY